jgi:hypothetical protein
MRTEAEIQAEVDRKVHERSIDYLRTLLVDRQKKLDALEREIAALVSEINDHKTALRSYGP